MVTTCSSATVTSCSARYFINSRGDEAMGTTWSYLDITPLGRQETWETRLRDTPRPRRTSGGTGTTTTTAKPRLTRSGSRYPTLEKPPSESEMLSLRRKQGPRAHWRRRHPVDRLQFSERDYFDKCGAGVRCV